jgi:hypothetical protein
MTKRATTMVRGYARRMAEVAKLAAEMQDIQAAYTRMMGREISTEDLEHVLTGDRLATIHAGMVADRPAAQSEFVDDVLEPAGDAPQPYALGAPALGLAPAPPVATESPLRHFHGGTKCPHAWADCPLAMGETRV